MKEKIKVTPEGRNGVWIIDKKEAVKIINSQKDEMIHNIISAEIGVIGADWSKKSAIKIIKKSAKLAITTGESLNKNFRHSLAVVANDTLYLFDIGEITEENLEVIEAKGQ